MGGPSATPDWKPSLTVKPDTFYFTKGVVPTYTMDQTRASAAGSLVVRAECDKGNLTVVVAIDGRQETEEFACDDQPHDRSLDRVVKNARIAVSTSGTPGTSFAIELVVRS